MGVTPLCYTGTSREYITLAQFKMNRPSSSRVVAISTRLAALCRVFSIENALWPMGTFDGQNWGHWQFFGNGAHKTIKVPRSPVIRATHCKAPLAARGVVTPKVSHWKLTSLAVRFLSNFCTKSGTLNFRLISCQCQGALWWCPCYSLMTKWRSNANDLQTDGRTDVL